MWRYSAPAWGQATRKQRPGVQTGCGGGGHAGLGRGRGQETCQQCCCCKVSWQQRLCLYICVCRKGGSTHRGVTIAISEPRVRLPSPPQQKTKTGNSRVMPCRQPKFEILRLVTHLSFLLERQGCSAVLNSQRDATRTAKVNQHSSVVVGANELPQWVREGRETQKPTCSSNRCCGCCSTVHWWQQQQQQQRHRHWR